MISRNKCVFLFCNPSLTFNPNLVKSISVSIIRAVREEQKASKIIIENKIDTFIEYLSKNVKK